VTQVYKTLLGPLIVTNSHNSHGVCVLDILCRWELHGKRRGVSDHNGRHFRAVAAEFASTDESRGN